MCVCVSKCPGPWDPKILVILIEPKLIRWESPFFAARWERLHMSIAIPECHEIIHVNCCSIRPKLGGLLKIYSEPKIRHVCCIYMFVPLEFSLYNESPTILPISTNHPITQSPCNIPHLSWRKKPPVIPITAGVGNEDPERWWRCSGLDGGALERAVQGRRSSHGHWADPIHGAWWLGIYLDIWLDS